MSPKHLHFLFRCVTQRRYKDSLHIWLSPSLCTGACDQCSRATSGLRHCLWAVWPPWRGCNEMKQTKTKHVKKIKVRWKTCKNILCLNAHKNLAKQPVKSATGNFLWSQWNYLKTHLLNLEWTWFTDKVDIIHGSMYLCELGKDCPKLESMWISKWSLSEKPPTCAPAGGGWKFKCLCSATSSLLRAADCSGPRQIRLISSIRTRVQELWSNMRHLCFWSERARKVTWTLFSSCSCL